MSLLPGTTPKTFNLLSVGQRAVGKTVFLAGSYVELHSDEPELPRQLWFDCQDSQAQEKIEKIFSYITQTGQYPPPTLKMTGFNFSLKRPSLWGTQTLCHFNWWDIPGESCNSDNPDFRKMVANSHGCCVFIDAFKLATNNNAYLQVLEKDIILQVKALADLVSLNGLKYTFALILTKYDLLQSNPLSQQQIEEGLRPLTTYLDVLGANYQIFYSAIPIVSLEGIPTLKAEGAAAPLLWLVWELSKVDNFGLANKPLELVTRLLPSHSQRQQSVGGLTQNLYSTTDRAFEIKKILSQLELRLRLLSTAHRYVLILVLVFVGSVGIVGALFLDDKWVYQRQPNNLNALNQPEHIKLRLQLAQSYETIGQVAEAETLYDQVLAEQKNNLNALVNKAMLRNAQGDTKMAEILFAQAEEAAPSNLKARVREVAQKTLQ